MRLIIFLFFILLIYPSKAQLYPIFEEKNIGYVDSTGNIVIPCKYDAEVVFYKFNIKNKYFIDFTIPHWAYFKNNSVTLKTDKFSSSNAGNIVRYSLFDDKGNPIISDSEDKIYGLSEGFAVCIHYLKTFQKVYDSSYSYIDIESKKKHFKYEFATSFNDGFALVIENDEYYFINKNFEKVFKELKIKDAKNFLEDLAAVKVDTLWGFIDKNGNWAIEPKFKLANTFNNGKAKVLLRNNFDYIDKNGKILEEELNFSEGLAIIEQNGKYVFVDKNNNIAIEDKFDYASNFENGLAKVWQKNELYYINQKGEKIHSILKPTLYEKLLKNIK